MSLLSVPAPDKVVGYNYFALVIMVYGYYLIIQRMDLFQMFEWQKINN